MAGQKRTRTGDPKLASKPQSQEQQDTLMTDTPPCAQAQPPAAQPKRSRIKAAPWNTPNPATYRGPKPSRGANSTSQADAMQQNDAARTAYHEKKKNAAKPATTPSNAPTPQTTKPNPNTKTKTNTGGGGEERGSITKRPRLPSHATLSKRPLLHPPIPSPFSSSANPKVLYITASSPFVPACKRIRALLSQIARRGVQAEGAAGRGRGRGTRGGSGYARGGGRGVEADGHLTAQDVEAGIAAAAAAAAGGRGKGRGRGRGAESVAGEEVYLKATGRAIPRALELGVRFQGEEGCRVRVEMGNVRAIDDVEVSTRGEDEGGEGRGEGGEEEDEEVPETRIRTLSTVTVCIGLV